jgi:hypothetical protein
VDFDHRAGITHGRGGRRKSAAATATTAQSAQINRASTGEHELAAGEHEVHPTRYQGRVVPPT